MLNSTEIYKAQFFKISLMLIKYLVIFLFLFYFFISSVAQAALDGVNVQSPPTECCHTQFHVVF